MASDWSDIPIGLRIKHQGGAFLGYLISNGLRSLLFGAAIASVWVGIEFRHTLEIVGICAVSLAICLGVMWSDAQAQYERERFRKTDEHK